MYDYLEFELKDTRAAITGGNIGIGLGIAKKFHQNNYFVIGRNDYGLEKLSENFVFKS